MAVTERRQPYSPPGPAWPSLLRGDSLHPVPSTPDLALAVVAMFTGAAVQGAVGFGANLVAAPVLALIDPTLVPVPLICTSVLLNTLTTRRESARVDRRELVIAVVGLVPGTLLGAALLGAVDDETLGLLFAAMVLVAAVLVASGLHVRPTPVTLAVAGVLSGTMGTTSSIGGPPIAVVHSRSEGPVVRATLARFFLASGVLSIAALAVAGEIARDDLLLALVLAPSTVVGFAISGPASRWLDEGRTRNGILVLCTLAAVAVVVREI